MLMTETNTPEMHDRILEDAKEALERRNLQADFEHGQWWITDLRTGAQWSVNDAETATGHRYFDYEQVTEGEEDCDDDD